MFMRTSRHVAVAAIILLSTVAASAATVTTLVPSTAPRGARVLIVGTELADPVIAVTFATATDRVAAEVIARTATMIEVRVPSVAVSGEVRIGAIAAYPFTVLPPPAFKTISTLVAASASHDLLKQPAGIAVAPSGTVYVADAAHHQIRAISPSAAVVVLAGDGQPGHIDGAATTARFHSPQAVVFDAARGSLWIADAGNHVIRRMTADGRIATVAGSGRPGDRDGIGSNAAFNDPAGLALDRNGDLIVADSGNSKIRRVSAAGLVTTLAGGFNKPRSVAVASDGAIFIADTGNNSIRKLENGIVSTIAVGFREPGGIAIDESGDLFVADTGNHAIRRISNGVVSVVAGTGRPGFVNGDVAVGELKQPAAVAVAGALFVADSANDAVRVLHATPVLTAIHPSSGPPAGGTEVRLFGAGFVAGGTAVRFGSNIAPATWISSTEIVATTPAATTSGAVDVAVTTPGGTAQLASGFTYAAPPAISSITPERGRIDGGETVTIRGTEFVSGATSVFFGCMSSVCAATSVTVTGADSLTAVTPASAAGVVDVQVQTEGGQATLPQAFTFVAPPAIAAFTPASGTRGSTVTIDGSGFDPSPGGTTVQIGAVEATVVSVTPTQIIAVIPTAAVTGRVSVTTFGGTAISAADFTVVLFTAITVAPNQATVPLGQRLQLTATGTYADGTTADVTSQAQWTSSNSAAAVVANGLVRGIGAGTAIIRATVFGISGTSLIEVRDTGEIPDPAVIAPPIDMSVPTAVGDSTSFLYSGGSPIQRGVAPGTIERRRAAVLRGSARGTNGQPIAGARVTLVDHPELGYTMTRTDGRFDLVVNGGGVLIVRYAKDGYLPVDRSVSVPWNDFVEVPEVVLVALDTQATRVDLAQTTMQVARGSAITDADGTRQATMLFSPGTAATLKMPDGSTTPLSALTVRATEYSVGAAGQKAMPAILPAQSGYTYCVELSADEAIAAGAESITFNKPVFVYVENFLGFPTGSTVPAGYYDRRKTAWVGSENGRVIKILSITSGVANVDTDGDGAADGGLQITTAERQQLGSIYTAGKSLWRVPVTHFTPWDYNWPYGPPAGATPPNVKPAYWIRPEERPSCSIGSIIECESRVLGEMIGVRGTPFTLSYRSDRTPGVAAHRRLVVNLSNATLPPNLKQINLSIEVAGQVITRSYAPSANLRDTIVWDGTDAYGRRVQGQQNAKVRITYDYPAVYQAPADFARSFGEFSKVAYSIQAREEIAYEQVEQVSIGWWDASASGIGGWSLSAQHAYHADAQPATIFEGGGRYRAVAAQPGGAIITTVAGVPRESSGGSKFDDPGIGGPASSALLFAPRHIAMGPDGSYYFTDPWRIYRVSGGVLQCVVGNGDSAADDVPAAEAALYAEFDASFAVGADGSVYYADQKWEDLGFGWYVFANRIRRVTPGGRVITIAGTRSDRPDTSAEEDIPAADATVAPARFAVGPDGSIYFSEPSKHRVRRILPNGRIRTVAGTGSASGPLGDGAPALQANLANPSAIAVDRQGVLYVLHTIDYQRLRRITPDGIITTIGGAPNDPNRRNDEEVPALNTSLPASSPALTTDAAGNVYVSDDNAVRQIDRNGVIRTIAGDRFLDSSAPQPYGDGGPALKARFSQSSGIAVGPDGSVYIVDEGINIIRRVTPLAENVEATDVIVPTGNAAAIHIFDRRGKHKETRDALTHGSLLRFTYDAAGQLASIIDTDNLATRVERNGRDVAIVAPNGMRTEIAIGTDGYASSIASAGEKVQFVYTPSGLLRQMTDPKGNVTQIEYDGDGLLHIDASPDGGSKTLTRTEEPDGYTVRLRTGLGRTTTYRVLRRANGDEERTMTSPAGLMTRRVRTPVGITTTTTPSGTIVVTTEKGDPQFGSAAPVVDLTVRTPGGKVVTLVETLQKTFAERTDPFSMTGYTSTTVFNGRTWLETFSVSTRKRVMTSPAGRTVEELYDAAGRLKEQRVPNLAVWSTVYDTRGHLSTAQQGNRTMTFRYDGLDRVEEITDSIGRKVGFGYDAAGRVTSQRLPDGRTIAMTYDANGNIESITPPGRPAHSMDYTAVNLLDGYTPPSLADSGATRYSYDIDRGLTQISRPGGQTIDFTYDSFGRLDFLTTSHGKVDFGFGASGNIASIVSPQSTLSYAFDGPLLTGVSWNGTVSGQVGFGYNNDLSVTSESVNGADIGFSYDADGVLSLAGALSLGTNLSGLLTGTTLGRIKDEYTYNEFGEVTGYAARLDSTPILSYVYGRDGAGRITTRTETVGTGASSTLTYEYDAAGRLTHVKNTGTAIAEYDYDSNGNRAAHRYAGGSASGTYDVQDRMLTYGGVTYTYTAAGDLRTKTIAGQTTTFDYDALGNLRSVSMPGTSIEYIVDGQQRRVGKKVNGQLAQAWLYATQLRIVAELDGAGSVVSRFVYGSRETSPDYMIRGGATYRILTDHLGSPRIVVNTADGTIAQRIEYDEFGRVLGDTNPGFQPFGFAGGLYDRDIGLVRFGARDYDPLVGRWTSKDPIGFGGGDPNLYGYVFADPMNLSDPAGLATVIGRPKNPYTKKLKDALERLRKELRSNATPACDAYFLAQPNPAFQDFRQALLTDGGPPYISAADRPRGVSSDIASYAQKGAPFQYLYVFKDFIDKNPINAEVPEAILHELGHLARQDTTDNEPQDFFDACKCGSLRPGDRR